MTVKMLSGPPASLEQRAPLPPADISGCREVGDPSKPQNALIMNSSLLQLAAASLPCTLTTRIIDPDVPGVPGSPFAPSLPGGPAGPMGPASPLAPAGPAGPATPVSPFSPLSPLDPGGPEQAATRRIPAMASAETSRCISLPPYFRRPPSLNESGALRTIQP